VQTVHSLITEIYIAPFQGYYSEALPIPALCQLSDLRICHCLRYHYL